MSGINKYLFTFVIGLIAAGLGGCGFSFTKRGDSASLLQPSASPVAMVASTPHLDSNGRKPATPHLSDRDRMLANDTLPAHETTVLIYTSDGQCQTLIPRKVLVSSEHAGLAAVGKVLEAESTADLSLAGYRVSIDQNSGVATVDLRTAVDSKWHLTSLSNCEQFALFGSLRRTLTGNAQWKIKDVHFTERGKEISL